MAITESDRAIIERYTGTLQETDLESVDARLARLGLAQAVALEILQIRRGDLDAHPDSLESEGIAASIIEQRARIDASIERCISYLRRDDVSLSQAAEDLLDEVSSEQWTETISMTTRNSRRGG